MHLETVGDFFLLPCNNVFNPHRLASEGKKHTHGRWRGVKIEFNTSQVFDIDLKWPNYNDAVL